MSIFSRKEPHLCRRKAKELEIAARTTLCAGAQHVGRHVKVAVRIRRLVADGRRNYDARHAPPRWQADQGSIAPEAPMQWACIDLVDEIDTDLPHDRPESKLYCLRFNGMSLALVAVPCALT